MINSHFLTEKMLKKTILLKYVLLVHDGTKMMFIPPNYEKLLNEKNKESINS